ncbi:MAG: domain containing protein [Pedosphaera sp.]|nr:domain containing protein [Pedosphaera sp.]
MKKRAAIICFLLLGLGLGIGLSGWLGRREPKYQGRTLSGWLELGARGVPKAGDNVQEAMRHMGTNSLPFLLEMVRAKDSAAKKKVTEWVYNRDHEDAHWSTAAEAHLMAEIGFGGLEEADGQMAVPALMKLMEDADQDVRMCAFHSLNAMNLDKGTQRQVLVQATNFFPTAVRYLQYFDQQAGSNQVGTVKPEQ